MKTGIATVSVSGTLPQKLSAIAQAGFDGIEIFEQDFLADAHSPAEIGRMIRDHGLEILLFQPFRDFEGLPEPLRRRAMDRAERKFDLMQALGVDLMLVCSSVHPQAQGGLDRAAEDLAELGCRAAARGLRVGFEALAWGRHVDDHRDAWEIVRRADHPNIGLILDSFHTLGRGVPAQSIRKIPGDRIFFVQLADAPRIDMDLLYWSRHFRNMPGEGDLPVADFLSAVLDTGYDGPLSLEIFNDQFRSAQPRQIAQDGHRALVALIDEVARRGGGTRGDGAFSTPAHDPASTPGSAASGATPGSPDANASAASGLSDSAAPHAVPDAPHNSAPATRADARPTATQADAPALPASVAPAPTPRRALFARPLPSAQPILGTAYLEIAVDAPAAAPVAPALRALGFDQTGRHASKRAELWTQNDLRVVVNGESGDLAGAAYAAHGPCIYEVGMVVADARAMQDRAIGLGAAPFSQSNAVGDALRPAIRGPGGLVIRFIAPGELAGIFQTEFGQPPRPAASGAGLLRVDHVAETVSYEEMLSSVLFYRTIFGMEKAPLVDVIDPDGLIRSQAMQSRGGDFRTTLNGAGQHRTLAGNFITESLGASIQHTAFVTGDIFATAQALTARRLPMLEMSENYYGDLAARFGLPPEEIERMRALNILYDEDGAGRFWQLYSRPLFGGFFAEIVQRAGGYDGYGAPNSPFRIAAMKRLIRPPGMPRG